MTSVKLKLVVHPAGQRDSVLEEEEDSKEAIRHFLDSKVGLKQLIQIVDCNKRLTIISKAVCKVYIGKIHLMNSVLSWRSHKIQGNVQDKWNREENHLLIDTQNKLSSDTKTKKHAVKSNKIWGYYKVS